MAALIRTQRSTMQAVLCAEQWHMGLHLVFVVAIALLAWVQVSLAQTTTDFRRTLTVTSAQTVTLDVDVAEGELRVSYGRDGEVSIAALARSAAQGGITDSFFTGVLSIAQSGNQVNIHASDPVVRGERISVLYQIDVPYRTKLTSKVNSGKQVITGILGPVDAVTNQGDIKATYVSDELQARVGTGNLDLQVIGGHVVAIAGSGNISCTRLPLGVSAETGDGDITLMVVGPTTAIVKSGTGRINVGGARNSLVGSTERGDLRVRAIPHQDWQLSSGSGDVRIELPPSAKFKLEVSTKTGKLQFDRDDLPKPEMSLQQFRKAINGGGNQIAVHTESGRIMIHDLN